VTSENKKDSKDGPEKKKGEEGNVRTEKLLLKTAPGVRETTGGAGSQNQLPSWGEEGKKASREENAAEESSSSLIVDDEGCSDGEVEPPGKSLKTARRGKGG